MATPSKIIYVNFNECAGAGMFRRRLDGMPLGIVSDMCGFGSEVELRQIFRKRTKMSMTAWRALRR